VKCLAGLRFKNRIQVFETGNRYKLKERAKVFICRIAVFLCALTLLAPPPALAQGAPRPFWVCVGADGERKAQDRACSTNEQTVSAPPGAMPPRPSVRPSPSFTAEIKLTTADAAPPAPAGARPNPFKPIVDVAVNGMSMIAAVLLAIGAIKVLLIKATKREKTGGPDRQPGGQSNRRDSNRSSGSPSPTPSWERYATDPVSQARTEPASQPRSAPTAKPAAAPLAWNIALIRELEWKRFEELCAQFWSRKGYPARLSGPGADGGVDVVIADQRDPGKIFAVAQCKSWSSKPVGVEPVRALWGAKDHFKANLALFYGLSGFTPDARAFAEGKHLKLISGEELLQQIMAMPDQDRATLLAAITRGDYTTPTCPTCDIKMNRRSGKDGKPDFWGCNNFRRCGAKPIPCRGN